MKDLPLAYLCISILAPVVAMATLAAMVKWGSRKVRVALPMAVAILLLTAPYWANSRPALAFLFIFIPVIFGVILSAAWLLAAESVVGGQDERIRAFSVIGAASMLGSVAGAGAARIMAASVDPSQYFTIGAVILLAASALIAAGHHFIPRLPSAYNPSGDLIPPLPSLKPLLAEAFVRSLFIVVIAASATGVLVEYLFYANASNSPTASSGGATYFANLYLWLNGGGLALQLAALPFLQRRLGLGQSLLLVPAAVCVTSLLFAVRFVPASTLRIVEGGLKSSFYRSGWEQSYTLVAKDVRAVTRILIDGVASRLGEGIAALGLMIGLAPLPSTWNRPAITAVALLGVVLTWAVSVNTMRKLIEGHEACVVASERDPEGHPVDGCALTATLGRRLA
ncbi:MAG: hypothetical protein HY820_26835 [Acidobacteria bacterium]|nr:hypothetical protein [Acidobacteriota bacterium]